MQEYAYGIPTPEAKTTRPRRRGRTRYSNKTKVALCYLITWSLAVLLPVAGLLWVFPRKLAGTAPSVFQNLSTALPWLTPWLTELIQRATLTRGMSAQALMDALWARDLQWRVFLGGVHALLWFVSLTVQLCWRFAYRRRLGAARAARSAIRSYRLTLLGIFLLNALGALSIYLLGVQFIGGKTFWDWLVYMGGFAVNVLAAMISFRFAAPPAISGKHSFFRRL